MTSLAGLDRSVIEDWALGYLARFAAPARHLALVLRRRAGRRGLSAEHEVEVDDWVGQVVARLVQRGVVDDRAYATARAWTLHHRGQSRRGIVAALKAKGVGREDAAAALAALAVGRDDPEREAALAYARRRGLGPFREAEARAEWREKDLAALGRRGFDWPIARAVIDGAGG